LAPLGRGFDGRSITRAHALPQVISHGYDRRMRIGPAILGGLMVLSGLVWLAQGLNLPFAPKSFMTADRTWVVIGAVTAVAGVVIVGRARRPT
jgi:hypothetical protein